MESNGLAYLHGQSVTGEQLLNGKMYHRDLKPSNILIVDGIMKIADFGLSQYKPNPKLSNSQFIGGSKHAALGVYAPPPHQDDTMRDTMYIHKEQSYQR